MPGRGFQHHPEVPHNLKQFVTRWNHDPVDEAAQRLTGTFALFIVLVLQRCRELLNLRPVDIRHTWMNQRRAFVAGFQRRQQGCLPLLKRVHLGLQL